MDNSVFTGVFKRRSKLVKIHQKYNNFFHINWFITNKCNFSCNYCHPFNHEGSSSLYDIDTYKNFISKVLTQIDVPLVVSFTGGEPTAMPIFDEFLDFLVENNVKIGITSNGSKSIKWWKKYHKAFDWISLSFHTEKSNTRQFIDIVDTVWAHSLVSVRVMMHPQQKYFEKGLELYRLLKTRPFVTIVHVEKVPIVDDWLTDNEKYHEYTPEQQKHLDNDLWFKRETSLPSKNKNEYKVPVDVTGVFKTANGRYEEQSELDTNAIAASGKNQFYNWWCLGGLEHLHVNDRGEIWPAACLQGKQLGNIDDLDNFNLPKKPLLCKKDFCYCATDMIISKERRNV
jgi:MoaA/NifB/PqqE/SkfB family radical SAM enzyme|tara:strand:+ start:1606 stop:2631 length:1026 start_codon:yes stop_codon:yes gene_type:complete